MTGAPRALIVDMDGVLYRGELPMPGLVEFFALIGEHPFVLLTNNSTVSAGDCAAKLGRMGVEVPASAILTVSDATSRYLASVIPPGGGALVLGSPALKEAVSEAGLELVPVGAGADVVVIGLDPALSYDALSSAVRLVAGGAHFVSTSLDPVLLTEEGVVPGAGALVAAIRACVPASPVCIGKPSAAMFEMAASFLGVPPEESLVIGDNLASDIAGGGAVGARTALLLSGVTGANYMGANYMGANYPGENDGAETDGGETDGGEIDGHDGMARPDFVFPGLPELSGFLRELWGYSAGRRRLPGGPN